MSTVTIAELSMESVELLPTRETLGWFNFNFANVAAVNTSTALNVVTALSLANSGAVQQIGISQS